MTFLTPSAHRNLEHACSRGEDCTGSMPGHALELIQERISSATPSRWRDAVVERVGADGWVHLRTIAGDDRVSVWHHADLGETLAAGSPVAVHGLYNVLAIGRARFNVIVASEAITR